MKKEDQLIELFPNLEFDEPTHKYYVNGKTYPSVSGLLQDFYEPFNAEGISKGYARKHGLIQEDVLLAWEGEAKKATDWGTKVHLFGEEFARVRYGIGRGFDDPLPTVFCKQSLGVMQFFNDLPHHIEIVACELKMYNEKLGYCGTADILAYNHNKKEYLIMDYKTNEKLTSDYDTKPLFHIPNELGLIQDSFGKYTAQLSFYQILLEEVGINVGKRCIIHLREQADKKLYGLFPTKDVTKHLRKYLKDRQYGIEN